MADNGGGKALSNTGKMAELFKRLRRDTNGAVADSMTKHGIVYPMNYGVSAATIREIAAPYFPDESLAKLLWKQDVRELRLAALSIADPQKVTAADLELWGAKVSNIEIAEHLASTLLGKSPVAAVVADRWLTEKDEMLRYSALITAARGVQVVLGVGRLDWRKMLDSMPVVLDTANSFVWQGAALMLSNLMRYVPEAGRFVSAAIEATEKANPPAGEYLREELEWQLDSMPE